MSNAKILAKRTLVIEPTGSICHFMKNAIPDGYLKANGAAISRTVYADLFGVLGTTYGVGNGSTTFNLPDLRGEFIRGFDDGRGIDSGRGFGSAQTQAVQSHAHDYLMNQYVAESNSGRSTPGAGGGVYTASTNAAGGTETRPRNIAVLACIKY